MNAALHRRLWRWHFYAGLFVLPFIIVLSVSGTVFLFKPQVDRWEERDFQNLPAGGAAAPGRQVEAALAAFPGAGFRSYRLPERAGDAAMVNLALPDAGGNREVFVSPQGNVLGSLSPESRLIAVMRRVHGQLLLGTRGSWLVELAASWSIVMLVTGMALWWPRGRGLAGVLWPRRRSLLRDLHAVTGFWVAGLALVLLLTGLPWADVWGSAFKAVREEMGWVDARPQDWTIGGQPVADGGEHAAHDHHAMMDAAQPVAPAGAVLGTIVAHLAQEQLAFPVIVTPPGASAVWTAVSDSQNRPLRATLTFDAVTGEKLSHERFSERHAIDQVIGYGTAWHEGQLFGVVNQLIGVLTAAALVTMSITGFMQWRRRKPEGQLGAPPMPREPRRSAVVVGATLLLAAVLPLLAASLFLLWLFDLLLPRVSLKAATWLGIIRKEGAT